MATALGFGQVSPQQRQRFMAFNQPQQATILNQLQKTNPLAAAMLSMNNQPAANIQPLANTSAAQTQAQATGAGPSFRFQDLNKAYQLDPRNTLADTLMKQGMRGGSVRSPLEGIGRLSQSLVGAMLQKKSLDRLEGQETTRQENLQKNRASILGNIQDENIRNTISALLPTTATESSNAQIANLVLGSALAPKQSIQAITDVPNMAGAAVVSKGPFGKESISNLTLSKITPTTKKSAAIVDGSKVSPNLSGFTMEVKKTNGEITGYEVINKPPTDKPNAKSAYNTETKTVVFATDQQVLDNEKLVPIVRGMKVSVDADGGISITEGLSGSGDTSKISKRTQGTIEADIEQLAGRVSNLSSLANSFKPEFFTLQTQFGAKFQGLLERGNLSNPEEAAKFKEYRDFMSEMSRVAAAEINALYGAALSTGESGRADQFIPTQKDSPSLAQSKLEQAIKIARRGLARKSYILKNGLLPEKIDKDDPNKALQKVMPLSQVDKLIDERAEEIQGEFKALNKDATDEQVEAFVLQQLTTEFGLVF